MQTHRRRRLTPPVLAVMLTAGLAAGCTNGGSGGSGDGELGLLLPAGTIADTVEPILDDFTAETGIEVERTVLPTNDMRSRQVLELNSRSTELDLVLLDDSWLPEVAHHLAPIDDLIEPADVDGYVPGLTDAFNYDGVQYGLPFVMSVRTLIYRTDLLEEAGLSGPPTTCEELESYAAELTAGDVYGFVGPWGSRSTYVNVWANLAYNAGLEGLVSDDFSEAVFADESGVAAAELMGNLYTQGSMPPDALELDHEKVNRAMQEGRAAMTILPTVFFDHLNDPSVSPNAGQFGIAPLPQCLDQESDRYIMTGFGWNLSQYSENPDAAWQLLQYINDRYLHPREDVPRYQLNSPASTSAFEHPGVQEIFGEYTPLIEDMLSKATIRPQTTAWSDIDNALADALQQVFLDETDAATALEQAEQISDDALAKQ